MQDSTYPHRAVWLDWLRAQGEEIDAAGIDIATVHEAVLAPASLAQRRLIVASIGDDNYHAFLIAMYRDAELVSLVLDDDEGHVVVLRSEA